MKQRAPRNKVPALPRPTEAQGRGRDAFDAVMTVQGGGAPLTISDLTISIPQVASTYIRGILTEGATIRRVRITSIGTIGPTIGVETDNGTLLSHVQISLAGQGTGVQSEAVTATVAPVVEDSTVSAQLGFRTQDNALIVRRTRFAGTIAAFSCRGTVELQDSLLIVDGGPGIDVPGNCPGGRQREPGHARSHKAVSWRQRILRQPRRTSITAARPSSKAS